MNAQTLEERLKIVESVPVGYGGHKHQKPPKGGVPTVGCVNELLSWLADPEPER